MFNVAARVCGMIYDSGSVEESTDQFSVKRAVAQHFPKRILRHSFSKIFCEQMFLWSSAVREVLQRGVPAEGTGWILL